MKLLVVHPGAAVSTADVYVGHVKALRALGHVVLEYRLDVKLQRWQEFLHYRWRKAKLPPEQHPLWAEAAFQAAWDATGWALYHAVDAVLVVSGMYFHPDAFVLMRRAGLHVGLMLTESPYDTEQEAAVAPLVDVVWTNERTSVPVLRQANPRTYYLPHAHDPEIHRPLAEVDPSIPSHDVLFIGTGFQERIATLAAVDWDALGVDLALYGTWDLLGSRHRLRKYVRGGIMPNAQAVALYRAAKINLNLFRTSKGFGRDVPHIEHADSLGPRLYELAAAGCFQVTDYRREVESVFRGAVPTFRTPGDMADLLRQYLAAPQERTARALEARQAVAPHTFAARAAQVTAQLFTEQAALQERPA